MFDTIYLADESAFQDFLEDMRSYDYDFDPDCVKFPCVVSYDKGESNGYPYITYEVDYQPNFRTQAIELLGRAANNLDAYSKEASGCGDWTASTIREFLKTSLD